MQVTQIESNKDEQTKIPKPTNEELQREYNYLMAEELTKKLLDKGLISVDEFNKIMAKNRVSFSPFIARIQAELT